jgi:hypothetical protein
VAEAGVPNSIIIKIMDYLSKLGYSEGSPFQGNATNFINSNLITMGRTHQPLVAVTNKGASLMQPGRQYNTMSSTRRKFQAGGGPQGGGTMEIPMETLIALEPMLLEAHLSTLSKKDKGIFMEKYTPLPDNMRRAALIQMIGKYPDVLEDLQEGEVEGQESDGEDDEAYQYGGPIAPLRAMVSPQESLSMAQNPYNSGNQNNPNLAFNKVEANPILALGESVASTFGLNDPYAAQYKAVNDTYSAGMAPITQKREELAIAKSVRDRYENPNTNYNSKSKSKDRFREKANGGSTSNKYQGGGALPDAFEGSPWTLVGSVPIPKNMTPASQGSTKSPSKSSVKAPGTKKSVKLQDDYTAEDEAFWEAQRKINKVRTDAESAKNYNGDTPVGSIRLPQGNTPPYYPPGTLAPTSNPTVSNTTAAIAQVTGDPVYSLTTTSMMGGFGARFPGQIQTPWYLKRDTRGPAPMMGRDNSIQPSALWDIPSNVKSQNNPLMPPREVTNRFMFVSNDRSGQYQNLIDPVTKAQYRRDNRTGQYFEGFSSNPDRTEAQQAEINSWFQR